MTVVDDEQSGEAVGLAADAGFELRLHESTAWRPPCGALVARHGPAGRRGSRLVGLPRTFRSHRATSRPPPGSMRASRPGWWWLGWLPSRLLAPTTPGSSASARRSSVESCSAPFGLFGALAIFAYVFKLIVPRGFVAIALPVGLVLLVIERFVVRKWIQRQRVRGRLQHRVVVVGNHSAAQTLADQVRREPLRRVCHRRCLPAGRGGSSTGHRPPGAWWARRHTGRGEAGGG